MSWRDNLRPASFRGVEFQVETLSTEVGRRNILHEFPFKDEAYLEDLGKSAGMYVVVGYVIQNADNDFDYTGARDTLIAALEKAGTGTLIHPFFGELEVGLIGKARIDENVVQGAGVARFSMTFALAGAKGSTLVPSVDFAQALIDKIDAQLDGNITTFAKKFEAAGALVEQASNDVHTAINMVRSVISKVKSSSIKLISEAQTTIAEIINTVDDLLSAPEELGEAITNTLRTYENLITTSLGNSLTFSLLELNKVGADPSSSLASNYGGTMSPLKDFGTETSEQRQANRDAVVDLVRAAAVLEASRVAVSIEYESYEQAYEALVAIVAAIDSFLEDVNVDDDELFSAMQDIKPDLVGYLLSTAASLPSTKTYEVPADITPTLVIAHTLYGDVTREQEIIDRNRLALIRPGFPPSGDDLEVSSE